MGETFDSSILKRQSLLKRSGRSDWKKKKKEISLISSVLIDFRVLIPNLESIPLMGSFKYCEFQRIFASPLRITMTLSRGLNLAQP